MKAIMVALLACVLVPAVALAQEGQAPGTLNTITGVNVTGGRVEIVGTKKPNFTTFTMTDPPRLVIDISEAVFSGVKEDLTVGNGTITGIRTASYGSDESAIARVLIGYEREVETDIQASGNSLVVTVAGSGGAAVAARPTTEPGTAPAGAAPAAAATTPGATANEAAAAAQTDRQQQEKAVAQAAAAAQTDRQQQEKAAAQSAAAAQADRQQQEKAVAQSSASAQADAEAQRQAQARAEADRKAQEEASRAAAQQAEQRRLQEERAAKESAAAAEKQRRQDEARAAADQKQRQQADDKARREAEAQAAADAKKRQQDEARAAAEEREAKREEARAAAEERRRQQAEARQPRVAQAETPRRAPEQGDSAGVSSRRKTMTLVGFKQEPASSRVFVRTNEPVRYTVTEGNKEVVLELENTRIAESNNTRSLNTSFFDTAVASVDADVGPSRTVRIAIKLKEQVTYETRQEGNEVSIEFQRPSRR